MIHQPCDVCLFNARGIETWARARLYIQPFDHPPGNTKHEQVLSGNTQQTVNGLTMFRCTQEKQVTGNNWVKARIWGMCLYALI